MTDKEFEESLKNKSPKYSTISIEKLNGGTRIISIPDDLTLDVQRKILENLEMLNLEFSDCSMAFKKKTSILDNAKAHLGNAYMIHYDLRNFFDTVYNSKVIDELFKRNVPAKLIKIIWKWCFYHGHLPQGAPTSPFLSNLVCSNLDKRFQSLAEKIGATYTRYADDIIISGDKNILKHQTVFKRIIRTEKFYINYKKIRIYTLDKDEPGKMKAPYHKVTGTTVGEKITVNPSYLNKVWKEVKKLDVGIISPQILGKISFVNFIDPLEGAKFYDYLLNKKSISVKKNDDEKIYDDEIPF